MYEYLLTKTWDDMMEENILIECNSRMHVIQIPAGELDVKEGSVLLIYYNIFDGVPNLLIHYFDKDITINETSEVDGYIHRVEKGKENSGADYTQIVFVRKELADEEDTD